MNQKRPALQRTAADYHALLNEAFHAEAWHGPTLRGTLRGVAAEAALWRPSPHAHNIWELVLHAAYWKSAVRGRITGVRTHFPLRGRNWFPRIEGSEAEWKREVRLLDEMHRLLLQTVDELPPVRLQETKVIRLLRGVALHDVYHTGQIRLLKRMHADKAGH